MTTGLSNRGVIERLRFTIDKVLISSSTIATLKRNPYPSKSIIYFGYFEFPKFLNIRIFIFDINKKTSITTYLAINLFS